MGSGFESLSGCHIYLLSLTDRITGYEPVDGGSIPLGDARRRKSLKENRFINTYDKVAVTLYGYVSAKRYLGNHP